VTCVRMADSGPAVLCSSLDSSLQSFDLRTGGKTEDFIGASGTWFDLSSDDECVLVQTLPSAPPRADRALSARGSPMRMLDRRDGSLLMSFTGPISDSYKLEWYVFFHSLVSESYSHPTTSLLLTQILLLRTFTALCRIVHLFRTVRWPFLVHPTHRSTFFLSKAPQALTDTRRGPSAGRSLTALIPPRRTSPSAPLRTDSLVVAP
jgi:hypothetical protein